MPADRYLEGIREQFQYHATWLPNAPRALGDVGTLQGGVFELVTSLKALGIAFEERAGPPMDLSHSSTSGVSIAFKVPGEASLAGSALADASAGAVVQFTEDGAFVFQAADCVERTIADKAELGRAILAAAEIGTWDLDWVVIDTLVTAAQATILVSSSRASKLELSASAKLPAGGVGLARAEAGLSVAFQSGDITHFIAAAGLAPLFRPSRISRGLFDRILNRRKLGPVRSITPEPAASADSEILEPV